MELTDVLVVTEAWTSAFPGAVVGGLVMRDVRNPEESAALEVAKRELEESLRARGAVDSEPVLRAYVEYYKAHGKSYHVKAQWESVALKGRSIPRRAALVEAMFMAELKNLILTAGHDLGAVELPVRVEVTSDEDGYVLMSGDERTLRGGDMMMVDGTSIISSVLYGPDLRTRITPKTRDVLFVVYAPAGVGERSVRDHLADIRANALLVSPEAQTSLLATLLAE